MIKGAQLVTGVLPIGEGVEHERECDGGSRVGGTRCEAQMP